MGERVGLAVVRGVNLVYVDQLDPADVPPEQWLGVHSPSTPPRAARSSPPSCRRRSGRALPAELPRYTPTTITNPRRLERELRTARERGWAGSQGEDVPYSNGVSAAVLDARTRPVAVVNVEGIEQRMPVARFPALGAAARATAARVAALFRDARAGD